MTRRVDSRLIVAVFIGTAAFMLPFFLGGQTEKVVPLTILIAICVFCVFRLRAEGHRAAVGSSSLVLLLIGVVYGIGLIDRPAPVFGLNPTGEDYGLVAIGMAGLLAGALCVRVFSAGEPALQMNNAPRRLMFLQDRRLILVALAAMLIASINYATGGIPILSSDVNGSRFAGNYGILGRLWPLILPVLQIVVIVAAIRIISNHKSTLWTWLGGLALIFLILSGGRSLFLIPIIAIGLISVDFFRPRFRTILTLAAAGIGVIGGFGYARTVGSSANQADLAYLGSREQNSWFGSLDVSVQTGPRVFSAARQTIGEHFLNGGFFWADFQNLFNSQIVSSDRLVTGVLNRQTELVGGLPPTIFGGFFLDWGTLGVVFGSLLIGFLLELFRRRSNSQMVLSTLVWSSYFSTYVLMSVYSYISFKPSLVVVALVCAFSFQRVKEDRGANPNGFQVSNFSGGR